MPTLALLLWPFISLGLFAGFGFKRGVVLSVVTGFLFLPSSFGINLSGLPGYNRNTAVAAGLVFGYLLFSKIRKDEVGEARSDERLFGLLLAGLFLLYALTPFFVYLTNQETLFFGATALSGLRLWDALSMVWDTVVLFVPFFVGWRVLTTDKDHRMVLRVLVGAGLIYSLLVLFEVRMSPQLHTWVYGYFPHTWSQHLRDGGFRPVVFLRHGLFVGLFMLFTVLAGFTLWRGTSAGQRVMFLGAGIWFLLVLFMSRNLGASMLAVLFTPVVLFLGIRLQTRIVMLIAVVFLLYPAVRQTDLLPLDRLTSFTQSISADRAASFFTRLDNEQQLLERAFEKPVFGWGGYGRNRIRNESGRDVSITDGRWIIVLGQRGWVGYIAFFGLLALPLLWLRHIHRRKPVSFATAGLALILAANFIYMIPNSALGPIGIMISGALAGFIHRAQVKAGAEEPLQETPARRQYSRFGNGTSPAQTANREPPRARSPRDARYQRRNDPSDV